MKVFIYCPHHKTGGPECLHQYCDMLNSIGADAYVFYWNIADQSPVDLPMIYTEKYSNLKCAKEIEDSAENLLIIPEIVSIKKIRNDFPNIRVAVAWLSLTYGLPLMQEYLADSKLIHIFQSYLAKTRVLHEAAGPLETFDLDDYISDEYTSATWDKWDKEDWVAYNPAKDSDTPSICMEICAKCVPIQKMAPAKVIETLKKCKVYMDLGTHPGRDRMPREAALLGCVVITNKMGSAAHYEDVMLDTRAEERVDQVRFVKKALENYNSMIKNQDEYVRVIKGLKDKLSSQMRAFILKIQTGETVPTPPTNLA
jgi:hypothetical protein